MQRLLVCGSVFFACLAVVSGGSVLAAVSASAPAKSVASAPIASPTTLSGSAGEWSYRCIFPSSAPNTAPTVCIVEQRLMMQDAQKQAVPLGGVILARATEDPVKAPLSTRPWRLTVMTPLGLSLQHEARFAIGKSAPFSLAWQSCVSSGCLSTLDLTAEQVDALRHGQAGHIEANKLAGGILTINFALTGVDVALKTTEGWIAHSQAGVVQ
ncbi:invasion associated locus B family protein [Acetobacter tropicalis]|uniref:invasion associated locus B family protein n=1 Tax=Acetobacter tropicalis TaxID=104102 RepID=UPI000777CFB9|nr:invasion associated locus B family protein [Acetobacter tropicalis]